MKTKAVCLLIILSAWMPSCFLHAQMRHNRGDPQLAALMHGTSPWVIIPSALPLSCAISHDLDFWMRQLLGYPVGSINTPIRDAITFFWIAFSARIYYNDRTLYSRHAKAYAVAASFNFFYDYIANYAFNFVNPSFDFDEIDRANRLAYDDALAFDYATMEPILSLLGTSFFGRILAYIAGDQIGKFSNLVTNKTFLASRAPYSSGDQIINSAIKSLLVSGVLGFPTGLLLAESEHSPESLKYPPCNSFLFVKAFQEGRDPSSRANKEVYQSIDLYLAKAELEEWDKYLVRALLKCHRPGSAAYKSLAPEQKRIYNALVNMPQPAYTCDDLSCMSMPGNPDFPERP